MSRLSRALWATAALLSGRASMLGLSLPLAFALFGAVRHHRPRLAPLVGLCLLGGSLSLGAMWTTLRLLLGMLAIAAAARWPGFSRAQGWRRAAAGALFGGAAAFTTRIAGVLWSGWSAYELAIGAAEALLTFVVGLALHAGIGSLAAGVRPEALRGEATLALALLAGGSLAGLSGLAPFGLPLALVAGTAAVIFLARIGGGAYGALAGVAVGVVMCFGGEAPPAHVGAWALAGMLAGIGGDFGTLGAVIGFGLGAACLSAVIREPAFLTGALTQTAIAGAALILLPERVVARARLVCRGPDADEAGAHLSSALWLLAANRLTVVASVFAELSQAFAEPAAALSAAVGQGAPPSQRSPLGAPGAPPPPGTATAVDARRLLARQLAGVSGITADLAGRMALGDIPSGLLRAREVEDAMAQAGRQVKQAVLAPAEHGFEIHVQCREAGPEGCEWCLGHAARAVRPVVGRHMHLARRQCAMPGAGCYFVLATEPRFALAVGVARHTHARELVSGDSVVNRRVGGHRHLLLLCDGMGKGLVAARESVTATRMVEAMLEAGFGLETTLHTINAALFLRSPQEAFTTIDLALLDLADGRLDLVKVGACPSYLYRDGKLRLLEVKSPPLGILDSIEVAGLRAQLRPGDLLVMVSDGVYAGKAGLPRRQDWLARAIERHGADGAPQGLADQLVEAAASRQRLGLADDMTVIVASLRRRSPNG
jgi:serine phosphatase RsbU (regulator of sigma subunit)